MKIVSAVGSFKGSIDSVDINSFIKSELEALGHSVTSIPVADGGDGLLNSLTTALGGELQEVDSVNALGAPIRSHVGIAGEIGIVEMALASGLALLDECELNPLASSTYGTGLLIKQLAQAGIRRIILGIGGSATDDGGFGCLAALGFEFYDKNGKLLAPSGAALAQVASISDKNVPESIKKLDIKIACDVTNPLLGENGATYVYAPQKGANAAMLAELERGMENYAKVVSEFCAHDYSALPGTGAAGGLGFGLMAMLGARLEKGAEIVLDAADFEAALSNAELVITGEGRIDSQTEFGKLPQIVASKANSNYIDCIALVGSSSAANESLARIGISKVYQLIDFAPLEQCMNNPKSVIKKALEKVVSDIM